MPVHPDLAGLNQALTAATPSRPDPDHPVEELRAGLSALGLLLGDPEPVAVVEDRAVPGPAGDVPVRLSRPAGDAPAGCLLYCHGGGFVLGDLASHDHLCRELTNRTGGLVVAVDYRRAPEHPYPAAVEDCWAVLRWLAAEAASLGYPPAALAVGGDSAGGNLAAVLARRARDAGAPPLCFQLLVYPVTDLHRPDRWPSRAANGEGYVLSSGIMDWFTHHYLGGRPAGPGDADLSPLLADDLRGLPPAHVVLAELDPLHDEGRAYADRLADAGVPVEVDDRAGAVHLFFQLGPVATVAREAVDRAAAAVAAAYGAATPAE